MTYPETDQEARIELSQQEDRQPVEASDRADDVAERVAAIMTAAEQAAAEMRREAEELLVARRAEADREAARVVEDARQRAEQQVGEQVAQARELAGTVVARATELLRRLEDADEVKRGVAGLVGELEGLADEMGQLPVARDDAAPKNGRLDAVEEARLMALQGAMAGRTRAEVEADLRQGFRVADPQPVLDDVFGKGTPGSQRIPWSGLEE